MPGVRDWVGLFRTIKKLAPLCLLTSGTVGTQTNPSSIVVTNPGFEMGTAGGVPTGWHTGVSAEAANSATAFSVVLDPNDPRAGGSSVRLDSPKGPIAEGDFGAVTNAIDATNYRGRRLKLTGSVRAIPKEDGQVGLWLRVDRAEGLRGFFDNMTDRPIIRANWDEYSIEADIAPDATKIVFGLLLVGHGQAWFDDVRLEDIGPARGAGIPVGWGSRPRNAAVTGDAPPKPLTKRGLTNLYALARLYGPVRFFHPSDEAFGADWDALTLAAVQRVELARSPTALAASLRAVFEPVAPSIDIFVSGHPRSPRLAARPKEAVSAVRWHHLGFGDDPGHIYKSERIDAKTVSRGDVVELALPRGVLARVPLAVWRDAAGSTLPRASARSLKPVKPAGFIPAGFDRTTRLAAVIAAWSMYQQFYPYFGKDRGKWSSTLDRTLQSAAINVDDLSFRDTLRRLVASLHDGHGTVPYYLPPSGVLPVNWDWIEGKLVITASGDRNLKRGDVIAAVEGVAAERAILKRAALESGSPQWTRVRALEDLLQGPVGHKVALRVANQSGVRTVRLTYSKDAGAVIENKPEAIAELSPGLFYVDIDRVTQSGFDARIADLARARGLILDLRGYPRMSPAFLQHLADHTIRSGHFVSLAFDRPDSAGTPVADGQWTLPPIAPRFTTNVAFITNARAISYSESVLSVIDGNHLADIVGSASAGANGNITFFNLPGGYQVSWTGMRVTNLDGSRHYLIGVRPTLPMTRTIAGIRAGHDELLDGAVALVKSRMSKYPSARY